jgi:tol-pal system protein YbgF
MKNLVDQTTDGVNKLNASVTDLNRSLQQQNTAAGTHTDQVSTQVQALQDSLDELKGRIAKLSKQLDDMQAAQQNLNAQPAPGANGASPAAGPQGAATQAPPPDVLYNNGLRDYNSGKYDIASQEFNDYLKYYANTDLAGNAQFYLADISYKQGNYEEAIKGYDAVLEQYPGGNKTAAAQLRKGVAEVEMGDRAAGLKDLQMVVNRYPRTIEATEARDRIRKLGTSRKPSPTRR